MVLQVKTSFGSEWISVNKGSGVPPWYGDDLPTFESKVRNKGNWYIDSPVGSTVTDFFYNQSGNEKLYIQYGQDVQDYASARFFSETLKVGEETLNDDGSVSADIEIQIGNIGGDKTTHTTAGWSVVSTLTIAGQLVFTYTGNSMDTYFDGSKPVVKKRVTIPPLGDATEMLLQWRSHYPNNEKPDLTANFGLILHNPTPPVYRPNAVRKGGVWYDHNSNAGEIKVRKNGIWVDCSTENTATIGAINQGNNRVRKDGNWRQATKMKGGTNV